MSDDLLILLLLIIQKTFVSVTNTDTYSAYSFVVPDEYTEIKLQTEYSYTDDTNSYVKYSFFIDGELIEESINPIFKVKKSNGKKSNQVGINNLEILLKACSEKIILQERKGQQLNMLKTFKSNTNQRSS